MDRPKITANLGVYVYGASAIVLGVVGLAWRDFATNWQRVAADVPHRVALAEIAGVYEILCGAAVLWRRTARAGALLLAVLYFVFASLWIYQVVANPRIYDSWGNFFEEFSLVAGGLILFAGLGQKECTRTRRTGVVSRMYGVCVISFGLVHVFYLQGAASYVPRWIPPGQVFWAAATAVFFFMAAAAILSGVLAGLASRLLTAMIVLFEVLIWAPKLAASPHEHFMWAGNAISIAMAGAAWAVADAINALRVRAAPAATPAN